MPARTVRAVWGVGGGEARWVGSSTHTSAESCLPGHLHAPRTFLSLDLRSRELSSRQRCTASFGGHVRRGRVLGTAPAAFAAILARSTCSLLPASGTSSWPGRPFSSRFRIQLFFDFRRAAFSGRALSLTPHHSLLSLPPSSTSTSLYTSLAESQPATIAPVSGKEAYVVLVICPPSPRPHLVAVDHST